MKKKRLPRELNSLIPEGNLVHEIECLKREVVEQKTLNENLKEEAVKRAQIHEEVVSETQKKDQLLLEVNSKAET